MELYRPNFLGIDWGKKKIGFAIAHAETRLALPWGVIMNDEALVEKVQALILSESVGTIVIGIPTFAGKELSQTAQFQWGKKMKKTLNVTIEYQEEMFTSKSAQLNLIQEGARDISQQDDAEAARIILQEWLDQKKA